MVFVNAQDLIASHWAQESQQAEVSPWRAIYGSPLCSEHILFGARDDY